MRHRPTSDVEREKSLKESFGEVGCKGDRIAELPVKGQKIPNLVCTMIGSTDSQIIIGAHFDHANEGDGVVDNWSGAALLPSLFQTLSAEPRKHTFVFIAFTGEEQGLKGSEAYAKQLTAEQITKIRVMINVDSLGLGDTKVWMTHSDKNFTEALFSIARFTRIALWKVNADEVGMEDSESFKKRHIPTLMLHSLTGDTFPILHTKDDNISAIKMGDYYDSYRLIATYLAYLDSTIN